MGCGILYTSLSHSKVKERVDLYLYSPVGRPVFTHGPQGPGPRTANFQGQHIKIIEIEVLYAGKKGCPRERNLREIYTENNVGITVFCVVFAQGHKIPKYGPACGPS
jgi:hypothetical protein